MAFTSDLLSGLAVLLEDAGIGEWHPDGALYAADEVAITLRALPDKPDRALALAAYPLSDHPSENDSKLGVQVRTRGAGQDPRGADDLGDAVFEVLHGLTETVLGGVYVIQALRQSSAPLGRDESGRFEATSNFHLDVARPTALRP
jgi:hypothetical protein